MRLVEVVSGLATERVTADTVVATAAAWGKEPVRATSTPGFIVNRCARPFYGEALRLLSERAADAATLDAILREARRFPDGGVRVDGPHRQRRQFRGDARASGRRAIHDPRYAPSVLQQERVAAGFLGRKSGRGFFDYASGCAGAARRDRRVASGTRTCRRARGPRHRRAARRSFRGSRHRRWQRAMRCAAFPDGAFDRSIVRLLALSDGRTATARGGATATQDLVLFDLALDYSTCKRIALAAADRCATAAFDAAAGCCRRPASPSRASTTWRAWSCCARSPCLANEAADAVTQGVARAR